MKSVKLICLLLLFSVFANAHVVLDNPVGGEELNGGEIIIIEWHVTIAHTQDNWDLQYSTDGGLSWIDIVLDLPNSQLAYAWTVPDVMTIQAQVRVIMDNVGTNYTDVSDVFTIGSTITALDENLLNNKVSIFPNPFSISTTFQVQLDYPADIALKIFDQTGQQVYSYQVYSGHQGNNTIKWNPENQSAGIYYFRLLTNEESSSGKIYLQR